MLSSRLEASTSYIHKSQMGDMPAVSLVPVYKDQMDVTRKVYVDQPWLPSESEKR